jgi:alpha-1,3-rhamnosyl/mannosyltransferase
MGLPKSVRQRCPLVIVGMTGWNFDSLDAELKTLVQSGEVRQLGYLSREDLAVVIAVKWVVNLVLVQGVVQGLA